MGRAEFILLASTLFGERWQTPLSNITGIASRTIRYMAAGERPVPAKLATALRRACEVMRLVAELVEEHGEPAQIDLSTSSPDQLTQWVRSFVIEALERANEEE